MGTPNHNSADVLCADILADARRESEEIIQRAKQQADALLRKAAAEADKLRQERLQAARTEAARRRELILGAIPIEAARLRSARIEELLQSVHDDVRRRLLARDGFEYRETLVRLAAEAIKQMPGDSFVVLLSAADRAAFGDELAEEIRRRVGRATLNITLAKDAAGQVGVVIIRDSAGRLEWDNSLTARLQRLWPELRRKIAVQTGLGLTRLPEGGGS